MKTELSAFALLAACCLSTSCKEDEAPSKAPPTRTPPTAGAKAPTDAKAPAGAATPASGAATAAETAPAGTAPAAGAGELVPCSKWLAEPEAQRAEMVLSAVEGGLQSEPPLRTAVRHCVVSQVEEVERKLSETCKKNPEASSVAGAVAATLSVAEQCAKEHPAYQKPKLHQLPQAGTAPPLACPAGASVHKGSEKPPSEHCRKAGGKLHGPARSWYPSGKQRTANQWRDGKKHGDWLEWHETGELAHHYVFENDQLEGRQTWWTPEGQLKRFSHHHDGKTQGLTSEWDEEGQQLLFGKLEGNQQQGVWYIAQPGSDVGFRIVFEDGKKVSTRMGHFPGQ